MAIAGMHEALFCLMLVLLFHVFMAIVYHSITLCKPIRHDIRLSSNIGYKSHVKKMLRTYRKFILYVGILAIQVGVVMFWIVDGFARDIMVTSKSHKPEIS